MIKSNYQDKTIAQWQSILYPLESLIKPHLRIASNSDDELLVAYLSQSVSIVESMVRRAITPVVFTKEITPHRSIIITKTKRIKLTVPMIDLIEIVNEDEDSLLSYVKNTHYGCIIINVPEFTLFSKNGFSVTYAAGYTDTATMPQAITSAILQLLTSLYENRGDYNHGLHRNITGILAPFRSTFTA